MKLNKKQFDAVLAGLRLLQAALSSGLVDQDDGNIGEILTNGADHEGLTTDEIGTLCEDINTGKIYLGLTANVQCFDRFQKNVLKSYDGGDHLVSEPGDVDSCGDGLLKYLLTEISESEGCESHQDAMDRIERSICQLITVQKAFAEAKEAVSA